VAKNIHPPEKITENFQKRFLERGKKLSVNFYNVFLGNLFDSFK